jgi:hypothetical protein
VVRRLPHVIALAAIVLLSVPTAASAAYSVRVESPDNRVVTGAKEIQVRVSRELTDPVVTGLRVRLASGGELRPTSCVSDCDRRDRDPVFAFDLDPRSGAPFATSGLRNGPLEIEGVVSREIGEDRSVGTFTLVLRVPGSAVGGLAATTEGTTVRLAWRRAPEPDVEGYRIERCAGACDASGAWEALGSASASASSFSDEPGVGQHSYRVVTIRDGGDGGDRSIETVSSPTTATVEPPARASDTGGSSGSGGNGNGGDGTEAAGDRDGGTSEGGRGADAPDLASRGSAATSGSRPGRDRSGTAPTIPSGRGAAGIPNLLVDPDLFEGELDYSGLEPRLGGADRDVPEPGADDEVLLGSPADGDGSFLGALTDPNRVAVPIAGGLLMTAIALHLWRWLRFPIT